MINYNIIVVDILKRSLQLKPLHVAVRFLQEAKIQLPVEILGGVCNERDSLQGFQVWVGENGTHQPGSKPLSSPLLHDEDIAEIGVGYVIGNDASEADLPVMLQQ